MKITTDGATTLSFAIALAGAALWLSTMHADLSHATAQISNLENYQKDIGNRLSRIEGKIDVLLERNK